MRRQDFRGEERVLASYYPFFVHNPMLSHSLKALVAACSTMGTAPSTSGAQFLDRLREVTKQEYETWAADNIERFNAYMQKYPQSSSKATHVTRNATRQLNILWKKVLDHPEYDAQYAHEALGKSLCAQSKALISACNSAPSWLKCIPMLSFAVMQLVVGHIYVHFKIDIEGWPKVYECRLRRNVGCTE